MTCAAVPYPDVFESVNTLIRWCGHNNDASHMANLLVLSAEIVKNHFIKPKKRTDIIIFFFKPADKNRRFKIELFQ